MRLHLTKEIECKRMRPSEKTITKMNVKNDYFCRHIINDSVLQTRIVKNPGCIKTKRKNKEKLIKIWDYPAVAITSFLENGEFCKIKFLT